MAPPHTHKPSLKPIEKGIQRHEVVVLADLGWGYKRISKKTGVPVPTLQGILQRYRMYGRLDDAHRSGCPTLLSEANLQAIERAVENDPRASLNDLTERLHCLGLRVGRTTINKATKQLGFKLRIPRKKPFLDEFQRIRRKYWCYQRTSWKLCKWRRIVWLDECKVEFSTTAQPGRKVE